ncbi:non-heme iron oxygenase ferredoxin subunit [Erwinia sp. AnSW2-5]|uniref:non-heme iron oxygenase ferredoxin subunit n=1 Tax=Erwinia sp. AnSW2-5 TaxID=3367692 RepID=UPI00385BEB27
MSWNYICDISQVQADFPFAGNIDGREIGVYLVDGEYYALEDVCPHAYALLSQGFVEDGKVECPLHEAVFDIKTGRCLREPGGRDLKRYPLRMVDTQLQISWMTEEESQ